MHLLRLRVIGQVVFDERVGEILQFLQIDRLIEFALRRGRLGIEPKAERARTIVG